MNTRYSFSVSDKEADLITLAKKEHLEGTNCPLPHVCCALFGEENKGHEHTTSFRYVGAAGGQFSYEFCPTGLGTCIVVKCACGWYKDCTDVDDW